MTMKSPFGLKILILLLPRALLLIELSGCILSQSQASAPFFPRQVNWWGTKLKSLTECTSCSEYCHFHHYLQRSPLPWLSFCSRVFLVLYAIPSHPAFSFPKLILSKRKAYLFSAVFVPVMWYWVILTDWKMVHCFCKQTSDETAKGKLHQNWSCACKILCFYFYLLFPHSICSHFADLLSTFPKVLAEKVVQQVGENSSYFQGTCSSVVPPENSSLLLCIRGNIQSISEPSTVLPTDPGHQWSHRHRPEKLRAGQKARKKTTRKWGPAGALDSVNLTSQKSSVAHFLHTLCLRVKFTSDQC